MKAEYTNVFKFAVNKDSAEVYIVFEQEVPELSRAPDKPSVVTFSETTVTEVSALTMSLSVAKNLAESLKTMIEDLEKGE